MFIVKVTINSLKNLWAYDYTFKDVDKIIFVNSTLDEDDMEYLFSYPYRFRGNCLEFEYCSFHGGLFWPSPFLLKSIIIHSSGCTGLKDLLENPRWNTKIFLKP